MELEQAEKIVKSFVPVLEELDPDEIRDQKDLRSR